MSTTAEHQKHKLEQLRTQKDRLERRFDDLYNFAGVAAANSGLARQLNECNRKIWKLEDQLKGSK